MLLLSAVCVFVSPVEKKEKRTVKPRELTPFEGMEVKTQTDSFLYHHFSLTLVLRQYSLNLVFELTNMIYTNTKFKAIISLLVYFISV